MEIKTLKWFRTGEPIPASGKYIRSEKRVVGQKHEKAEDWPPYGGGGGWHFTTVDITDDFHLYEVALDREQGERDESLA